MLGIIVSIVLVIAFILLINLIPMNQTLKSALIIIVSALVVIWILTLLWPIFSHSAHSAHWPK